MARPAVISSPESAHHLKQGFDQLAELLAVTLGPTKGHVISWSETKQRPELLDTAATIARRVIQLPDPRQDVGAMMLRQMVWQMHQRVGDGGSMAAVLAQAILHEATRMVAAGGIAVYVQKGMEKASHMAIEALRKMAKPADSETDLMAVAMAVTGHEELSWVLAEMFDLLGVNAYITIEKFVAPYLERLYINGGLWRGSYISPYLINSHSTQQAVIQDCHVILVDKQIRRADDIKPILDIVARQDVPNLFLVAPAIDDEPSSLLVATHEDSKNALQIVAAKLAIGGEPGQNELDDLALLTGATIIGDTHGRALESIRTKDLGFAKRAEAGKEKLFVIQGRGNRNEIREKISALQSHLEQIESNDEAVPALQRRLARLSGSSGILQVGAHTKPERDGLHQMAEHAIKALSATLEEGYLPGGGVAYLHAAAAIDLDAAENGDERMGMIAMQRALEIPCNRILTNAGVVAPAAIVDDLMAGKNGTVYDARHQQFVSGRDAYILDPAKVIRMALESATSCAAMALSVDTTVLKKNPRLRVNIDP